MAVASLVRHVSNYSLGSLAVTLAGLVSFPLLTRLLGVEGYGYMSLITLTLTPLVSFGKCGLQHSAMVFYTEARTGKQQWGLDEFYTTVLAGMGISGLVVTLLWFAVMDVLSGTLSAGLPELFRLAAPLVLIRVLQSALLNILRARELSGTASLWQVAQRYTVLLLVVAGLVWIEGSVEIFLLASIIAETLVLLSMSFQVLRGIPLRARFFSRRLFAMMVMFGVPMLGFELAGVATNIGDRYVVEYFLGAADLGRYSAAYNLSEYVAGTLVMALASAALPMYLRIWTEKGREATAEFLRESLRLYTFVALPLAAGFSAVAESFISLMASEEFAGGAEAIPFVILGLVVNGSVVMLAAGLYVHRQSTRLMKTLALIALVNLLLNIVMVPRMGILGAAVATLASYMLYAALALRMSAPVLKVPIPWKNILAYSLAAIAMYALVVQIDLGDPVATLPAQISAGILVYGLIVFVTDPESRALMAQLWDRMRG